MEIVNTDDPNFAAVHTHAPESQPKAVEKIFEELKSTEHSEVKVIDVRQIPSDLSMQPTG